MKCYSNKGFVIGDPCYVLDEEVYDKIWGEQNNYSDGEIKVNDNFSFCVHGTSFGDGSYMTSTGTECGVDSGTLAVIPVELMGDKYSLSRLKDLVCLVWIDRPGCVELEYEHGTFLFILNESETISIDTDYDNYYEQDFDDSEEEDN